MYHVSAQGIDERMIKVHYYFYLKKKGHSSNNYFNVPIITNLRAEDGK